MIFIVELMLRIYVDESQFFLKRSNDDSWHLHGWNIFDFILVWLAVLNTFVLYYIADQDVGVFYSLRMLRLARLARIIRLLRFFKELWLLVVGVFNAMRTLVWAWMLI